MARISHMVPWRAESKGRFIRTPYWLKTMPSLVKESPKGENIKGNDLIGNYANPRVIQFCLCILTSPESICSGSLIDRLVPLPISDQQKDSLYVFTFRILGSKIGPSGHGDEFQVRATIELEITYSIYLQTSIFRFESWILASLLAACRDHQAQARRSMVFETSTLCSFWLSYALNNAGESEGAGDGLLFAESYRLVNQILIVVKLNPKFHIFTQKIDRATRTKESPCYSSIACVTLQVKFWTGMFLRPTRPTFFKSCNFIGISYLNKSFNTRNMWSLQSL